ncbi:hypothetical protein ACFYO1_08010 [Nocardia sp. NPDC006044]|uniref:hypothetical protein n=1 Tax=Nocardia sp. NPDC006044 TaxID=3364306 RepID=UPI0036C39815
MGNVLARQWQRARQAAATFSDVPRRISALEATVSSTAQRVSTRPTVSSYTWGGRRSPLAFMIFHTFFLVRLLSPLQWLKFRVRQRVRANPPTTNMRPDFPAAYTEWYFLGVLALALSAYLVRHNTTLRLPGPVADVLRVLGWILLIECVVWMLYYLMLRAFVERYYTIFHPAEYMLMFPLTLVIQTLLLSDVTGYGVIYILQTFTGSPAVGGVFGTTLAVFRYLYLGAAITVVLSSHPGIATRPAQNISVIGAGDVTVNRILPALKTLGYARDEILIASLDDPETAAARRAIGKDARLQITEPDKVLETALREHAPTVIASPTFAHFTQLVTLATAGIPFAVEKPITAQRSEREILRAQGDSIMACGFALSYYSLEKGLPLTYLMDPLPSYLPFLAASEPGLLGGQALHSLREELGPVRSVRVELLEGASRSPSGFGRLWTEVPGTLHTFIETTIHPLLMMRHIIGPGSIVWQQCALGRYAPRAQQVAAEYGQLIAPTWIEATGTHGSIDLSFLVAKHLPDDRAHRAALIEYAGGKVTCDFDSRRAEFRDTAGNDRGWIAIDNDRFGGRYRQNYAVQMEMFMNFAINGWGAVRFDDFVRQLDALDAWDDLCDAVTRNNIRVSDYDASTIGSRQPQLHPVN